jgi:outer membrane lipoprotein LolB
VTVRRSPGGAGLPGLDLCVALAVAALLSTQAGCTTLLQPTTPASSSTLEGRLAVQVHATESQAARSLTAPFSLRGTEREGLLELATPVGTILAQAAWGPQGVRLTTPEGTQRFDSLEALSQAVFGEPLPLAAVLSWLRGTPWHGAAATAKDGPASPKPWLVFYQLGWTVDVTQFRAGSVVAERGSPLPRVSLRARLDNPLPP